MEEYLKNRPVVTDAAGRAGLVHTAEVLIILSLCAMRHTKRACS